MRSADPGEVYNFFEMFPILEAKDIAPEVRRFVVEAPRIAKHHRAGQFVIVRVHPEGERIPLTIADADPGRGTITLAVQGVGKTTKLLNALEAGDAILDVVGPLGQATEIDGVRTAAVVGGGVGAAIAYPVAKALHQAGCRVIGILGARTKDHLIFRSELEAICKPLLCATDDGSAGRRGLVTEVLSEVLSRERLEKVWAIGPVAMMRAVAELTRPLGLPTLVSLNAVMIDGTGMCGGCRVQVGGEARFACVDGPEFDAHAVDFEALARRNAMYRPQEQRALEAYEADPEAALSRVRCALQVRDE